MVFTFGGTQYDEQYNRLREEGGSGAASGRESGAPLVKENDNVTVNVNVGETAATTASLRIANINNANRTATAQPRQSSRGLAALLLAFAAFAFIYGFGLSFIGYPDNFTSNYDLLPGQSVRIDTKVNELWYKRAHVYTRDEDDKQGTGSSNTPMGVFYYADCPAPDLNRKTSFSTRLDDRRNHQESFYLLKGSSFNLTWETSRNTTLHFYKHPTFTHSFKQTTEQNITFKMDYSGYLYLEWIPKLASTRFQGNADFDFNLRAYDHSIAGNMCVLNKGEKCTVSITDSKACAILDIIDFAPYADTTSTPRVPNSTVTTLSFTKDGGKYFLIVPFPLLIIFLFFTTMSIYCLCTIPRDTTPAQGV
mmetsp:Transcript_21283/g.33101  ORF Transcript_21283/g.33101 Transcript_21283/m.33101 type:complete len:364 (-) Transcript_21283:110-1201(-)|eukprot:CAMPEP_0201542880 /NCGR_PEP_ID=MMETSP0161_2-20130828/72275_1 /ASSEMBLY_ACC=CAM_ASM_000251 /TAXON_ID=180227 /ORGANISM="Neoparamoeba aestuarina, Strain SoJaBio B1-5/56/2" /LENGTH=363 /DNA_ID=CAMNT_0047950569 /DNA_START=53 /DNA_END=1144 /DNA_ORIENTATION=-